jgi:hypothetical protein
MLLTLSQGPLGIWQHHFVIIIVLNQMVSLSPVIMFIEWLAKTQAKKSGVTRTPL